MSFSVIDVRQGLSEELKQSVLNLWHKEGVLLSGEQAKQRLQEIFALAVDDSSLQVIGVSSTYVDMEPLLSIRVHYIRAFVDMDHRQSQLAVALVVFVIDTLDKEFEFDNRLRDQVLACCSVLENQALMQNYKKAFEARAGFYYYGVNNKGRPAWVHYFPGARF